MVGFHLQAHGMCVCFIALQNLSVIAPQADTLSIHPGISRRLIDKILSLAHSNQEHAIRIFRNYF